MKRLQKSVVAPASTAARRPHLLRRATSGFADYFSEVKTAMQAGRGQHHTISAFKR